MKTNPLIPKIALLSFGLSLMAWSQTPLPIVNPSFEDPATDAGTIGDIPTGWTTFGTANVFGVLNPTDDDYPDAGAAPDGLNVAIVFSASGEAGYSQILTAPLTEGSSYSLSVSVGNTAFIAGFPGYRVQLLADGVVLAEDDNSKPPAEGTFEQILFSYTYNSVHEPLLGKPLEIRLINKGANASEVHFDNLLLEATLAVPVANAGGPYVVYSGGSLQLDGSGSLPSEGAEIVSYQWDLNNDNNFGDAADANPDPISFDDLQDLWDMEFGPNTIQLRVTDSAGKSSIVQTTVTLSNLASQLGILDLNANDGKNPATGEPWAAADSYHLAYVTTDTTVATSTDIAYYNAFVQTDAAAQTGAFANMGNANWFAMGSTATTNARDNAVIIGPLINIFNQGVVAINSTDFYNFNFTASANPTTLEGGPKNLHTGTLGGGTTHAGNELGAANGTLRIAWSAWTNWSQAWRAESTSDLKPMLGISGRLFVIDLLDAVAPEFVSFENDVVSDPIEALEDSVVYTVTFSEAMLPSMVTAADFGNAGDAGFVIDSIVQQMDPAVFLVTVTPTGPGTLQLQINQGAVLTDLNGNPLDTTSSAIVDTAVIEVIGGTPYGLWADGFPGLTDSDPALDFDGGGLATGIEWVLGGDPTNPADDAAIAPTFDNASDGDFFIFTYRRTQDAEDDDNTTIAVEYGSDLVGWTTATEGADIEISVNEEGAAAGIDLVEVKIRRTLAVGGKLFARLKVDVDVE